MNPLSILRAAHPVKASGRLGEQDGPVPQPPTTPSLQLDRLTPGTREDLIGDREHDGLELAGADLSGVRALDRELLECLVSTSRLDDAVLTGSRLRETRFERCEATALRLDASELREVEVDGCRIGAVDAYDAQLRQVRITQCRLGYVNLRGARLHDVLLEGCELEDLDLGSAYVERLALVDCSVGHLLLPGAELVDADLRGAVLHQLTAPEGLRGATVTPAQLDDLAPVLAEHLGIEVLSST